MVYHLIVENDVLMEQNSMNSHDKRFRPKASSASRLSPIELGLFKIVRFIFLENHHCDTVSKGGEEFGRRGRIILWES